MSANPPGRIAFIDSLRGLAVVSMFHVHSAVAWIRPELKSDAYFQRSMILSGMVAPTFMFLAGVAIALVADKSVRDGTPRGAAQRRIARRGLQIMATGYALHVIFYLSSGHLSNFHRIFKVDILHCIGLSMAICSRLCWPRSDGRPSVAAPILFIAAPLLSMALHRLPVTDYLPLPLASYITFTGRLALFPVVPYIAWMALGLFVGPLLTGCRTNPGMRHRFWLGLMLGALGLWLGGHGLKSIYYGFSLQTLGTDAPQVKGLIHSFWTKGALVLGVFLLSGLTARFFDARPWSFLVRFGKESLFAYALHLFVVYPLLGSLLRERLTVGQHLASTALLTAGMFGLVVLFQKLKQRPLFNLALGKSVLAHVDRHRPTNN